MNNITEEQWIAWAAGIFEGEGGQLRDHPNKNKKYERAKVRIIMNDEDVIRRFHEVVKLGILRGPIFHTSTARANNKPSWKVEISRWSELKKLFVMFDPYLGNRRREWFLDVFETCKPKYEMRQIEKLPEDCGYCKPGEATTKGYRYHIKHDIEVCKGCHKSHLLYLKNYRSKDGLKS